MCNPPLYITLKIEAPSSNNKKLYEQLKMCFQNEKILSSIQRKTETESFSKYIIGYADRRYNVRCHIALAVYYWT